MKNLLFASIFLLASCMTTSPQERHQRTPDGRGIELPSTSSDKPAYSAPTDRELLAFIQKYSNPNQLLSNADLEMISRIPPRPEQGSVQEAALAVVVLKKVLAPENAPQPIAQETTTVQSRPVIPAPNAVGVAQTKPVPTQQSLLSLEKASQDIGLNFVTALDTNILLKNTNFFVMTQKASERGTNSESFQKNINELLGREIAMWKGVAVSTSGQPMQIPIQVNSPPPGPTPPAGPDLAAIPSSQSPAADEQMVLKDAQSLADSGNFLAAIEKVESIPSTSTNYIYAQDRVKFYSNSAVRDLRIKAATEFQSASPVVDTKVKRAFLEKAEFWLKEAMEKYPKAENLRTVQENLTLVQKELESVK